VIVTGSLPCGARVSPERLEEARPKVFSDHVIGLPPRFDTDMAVVEGALQLPASTLVGVTPSVAGNGVAVGDGVGVRVGVGVAVNAAVGLGVGLATGFPGDDVVIGDVVGFVPAAVVLGCTWESVYVGGAAAVDGPSMAATSWGSPRAHKSVEDNRKTTAAHMMPASRRLVVRVDARSLSGHAR